MLTAAYFPAAVRGVVARLLESDAPVLCGLLAE
jgi:hypothetical protein